MIIELVAIITLLVAGVPDPTKTGEFRHQRTFISEVECEAYKDSDAGEQARLMLEHVAMPQILGADTPFQAKYVCRPSTAGTPS